MLDWIVIAVGGGLLAAGCATGSALTKLLQRLLFSRKGGGKPEAVKEAVSAQDVEANHRDTQGSDGMEDLLFDEKLKLLVMKENLKKKLLQQTQLIRQLMGGGGDDVKGGQTAATEAGGAAASSTAAAATIDVGIAAAGDKVKADAKVDRQARAEAEVEYFASELELSKWQN